MAIAAQALLFMCELVYNTCILCRNAQVHHWLCTLWQPRVISGTAR